MGTSKHHPAIIEVSDADFDERVKKSKLPVVVDFWAQYCGPCRMLMPILDKLAAEYEGRIIIAKVNTEEYSVKAAEYEVRGIPTLLFFSCGEKINTQVGNPGYAKLHELFEELLAKSGNCGGEVDEKKSAAETAFATQMEAIEGDYMKGIEKELEAFQAAAEPFREAFERRLKELKAKLEGGEIDDTAYRAQYDEALAPMREATKPEKDALAIAVEAASKLRDAAIAAAVEVYLACVS